MDYPVSSVTDTCITVFDSWKVSKKTFDPYLNDLRSWYDVTIFKERSNWSLTNEWACHNLLYDLHLFRSHTKDVDMQYPLIWWEKIVYPIFGPIAKLFIS